MRIDTWINNELVSVDTDDVWLEVFAHWDARVPTDTAAAIATATQSILERSARGPEPADFEPARRLDGGTADPECFD